MVKNLAIGFIGEQKAPRIVVNDNKKVQDPIYLSSAQINGIYSTWLVHSQTIKSSNYYNEKIKTFFYLHISECFLHLYHEKKLKKVRDLQQGQLDEKFISKLILSGFQQFRSDRKGKKSKSVWKADFIYRYIGW